jgi:hypothetical protein
LPDCWFFLRNPNFSMRQNVGGWDRNTRWILGASAILAALMTPMARGWRLGLLAFGAAQLITAASSYCPLNEALGIDTQSPLEKVEELADEASQSMAI